MRFAGLPHVSYHLVGAAAKHALAYPAAVFCAETLAFGGGGAARHGARLLSAAVFEAMRRSTTVRVAGASFKLARSVRAMLDTDTTCLHTSVATFLLSRFPLSTAAVFVAKSLYFTNVAAAFC